MNAYTKALEAGFNWVVVAAYDHDCFKSGDIISRHRRYDLAEAAAKKSYASFRKIVDVTDYAR